MQTSTKSYFSEVLRAANECPQVNPLLPPKQKSNLTTQQKRTKTAIIKSEAKIIDLQSHLQALIMAKRIHFSNDTDQKMPTNLLIKIRKTKWLIWQAKTRLNKYRLGQQANTKIIYQDSILSFDDYESDIYIFFRGIFSHDFDQWSKFSDKSGQLPERSQKEGKAYSPFKQKYYDRIVYINKNLKGQILLNPDDCRWLILRFKNVEKRLIRERSLNDYLPKESNQDRQNDDYRREFRGSINQKKYHYYDIEEITSPRDLRQLMAWYGCQLRDDERDMLIALARETQRFLLSKFIQPEQNVTTNG